MGAEADEKYRHIMVQELAWRYVSLAMPGQRLLHAEARLDVGSRPLALVLDSLLPRYHKDFYSDGEMGVSVNGLDTMDLLSRNSPKRQPGGPLGS